MRRCLDCELWDKEKQAFKCNQVDNMFDTDCLQKRLLTEVSWLRGHAARIDSTLVALVRIFQDSSKIQRESSEIQKQAQGLFGQLGKMMEFAEKEMNDVQEADEWKEEDKKEEKKPIDPDQAKKEIDDMIGGEEKSG